MTGCCVFHASAVDRIRTHKIKPPTIYENRWLKSQFGTVRYIVAGQPTKQLVVVMPDPPNSIEQMAPLIDALKSDFCVVAFEAPGFGYSRQNEKFDYSLLHNAQVIIEVVSAVCAGPAILAMTCVGALPAIFAAKLRPDLVSGLVLGQTPSIEEAKRWASNVDVSGLLGVPYIGQLMLRVARNRVAENWYKGAFPKGHDSSSHYRQTRDSFRSGALFSLASAFQAINAEATRSADLIVNTNAVVLWGGLDRTHRKTNKHGIMDCLPNGVFVDLPSVGHFPDIEMPSAFANAVKRVAAEA